MNNKIKLTNMNEIGRILNSLALMLSAHPDNEEDSEFSDRLFDVKSLPQLIEKQIEKNRLEGVLLGLKICKEMWAQGTVSHENIVENEVYYKEELKELMQEGSYE